MEAKQEGLEPYQSFRVATLLPGQEDDPIRCKLEEAQWSDERRYEAVSYAWGDPSLKEPILVHDKTLQVTRNLKVALGHLRHKDMPRVNWVDAICTNQSDIPERGAQVRQMRRIFESATAVLIWLGPDNAASQAALVVRAVQRIAELVCRQLDMSLDSLASVEQVYHTVLFRNRHRLTLPKVITRDMWDAVLWLFRHTYFTRVWVIQEINANRSRPALCGRHAVSWDAVELVAGCVVLASTFAGGGEGTASDLASQGDSAYCWWASTAPSELRQAGNWLHMLYLASNFAATDARDVVYGLRGMMNCESGGALLDPDYSKTTLQVYRDVVEASLINYKRTDALLYVAAVEGHRPSWIPFWNEPMLFRNPFRFGNPMPWKPAGDSEARWVVDQDKYILSLEGFFLGAVQAAASYRETMFRGEHGSDVASTWQRILSLLTDSRSGTLPLSEDTLTACATSFCYGQDETCQPAAEAKLARNFVAYLKNVLSHQEFSKYIGPSFSDPDQHGDGAVFGKPVWDFEYPEASFFVTDDKSMGCCTAPVAAGDVVFVPLGCTYPLVLRADSERGFRVQGYCFVHGAMRGERRPAGQTMTTIRIN